MELSKSEARQMPGGSVSPFFILTGASSSVPFAAADMRGWVVPPLRRGVHLKRWSSYQLWRAPMLSRSYRLLAVLLIFSVVAIQLPIQARAQVATPNAQELDQLLAPIALYPDSLLAQITTASTNPQEILDVDNWLAQNPNLTGTALTDAAQQQGFDPAFIALVNFPSVLQMMAENIDDYAAIGQAVTANQGEVSDSIQRLRAQAYTSGALRSNQQQQVEVQQSGGQPIYVIQPASPQVVY